MNEQQAIQVVNILKAAFPHVDFPSDSAKLYRECILDLPFAATRAGVLNLITEPDRRFMPAIGEIRAAVLEAVDPLPTPEEAWGEVMNEIHNTGSYGRPQFSHPAIEKAVRAVDWKNICLSETPGVERAHFLRVYASFRERHQRNQLMLPEAKSLQRQIRASGDGWPALTDEGTELK